MPIGVPRIIYSWGEELPAQWTDIYNFIFRRRMVFLMQYLDDELCNQICGLLINIHMEDRSKDLEKNESDSSGATASMTSSRSSGRGQTTNPSSVFGSVGGESSDQSAQPRTNKKKGAPAPEDLLNSDEDLGIDDIDTLEQLTLQKITKEWLNWNSQFFDYSDEPYLYYLAQTLSKDFGEGNNTARSPYDFNAPQNFDPLKNNFFSALRQGRTPLSSMSSVGGSFEGGKGLDIYSAFRTSPGFTNSEGYSLSQLTNPSLFNSSSKANSKRDQLLQMFKQGSRQSNGSLAQSANAHKTKGISKFLLDLAGQDFIKNSVSAAQNRSLSEKALGQRQLRREYNRNSFTSKFNQAPPQNKKAWRSSSNESYNEFRDYFRKQTERSFIEEESKKVFVIINSFGGSVGNGITVHDALQFIKAGSLTLGLGVAASASSLVLAGGTIGERYVTEGCHTMIHQPECLTGDHDVLTDSGWKPIPEITLNDKVAVLKENKYLDYEHPTKIHQYDYKGNMYYVKNNGIDLFTTPNHRMFINNKKMEGKNEKQFEFKLAEEIYHQKVRYKKDAIWNKPDYQFMLPSVLFYNKPTGKKTMLMDPFLRFLGMWIAEGWTEKENTICISQKKTQGQAYIERFLNELGYNVYSYTPEQNIEKNISGCSRYSFRDKQLAEYLNTYSVGPLNKRLPNWVWELSSRQCLILLEGLIEGDGHINKNDNTQHYFTSSKGLAEDVSRLILHAGFAATYALEDSPSRLNTIRTIQNGEIKSDGPMYRVNLIKTRLEPYMNYSQTKDNFDDSYVPFEGKVHCLTVPSGVFYTQRNGIPIWTGNSSLQGQASDIWIDSQEIMKIRLDVAEIYSLSTYRPRHKILRDLDRDFYLTAPETIAYGLADEIATNEVMHEIVEMTAKVWDVYDGKQQRLLESRESASSGTETQTQS